jgi:hypothetical protein
VSTYCKWFLALNLAILLGLTTVARSDASRKLTEAEARELARLALAPNARTLPNMRFDTFEGYPGRPGFYWFEIAASVPDGVSPILGHYAVNQATGDVWEPVQCRKVTSFELTTLQHRIREVISLTERDLRRLSKVAPCEP